MDFHATTQDAYASYSEEEYFERKCEYIPLSAKLIEHVRRLDSLSDQELWTLRTLMTQVGQFVKKDFKFDQQSSLVKESPFRKYLEYTLKIHQIFALVDVDFKLGFGPRLPGTEEKNTGSFGYDVYGAQNAIIHFREIAEQLKAHNGLNYVPRERTPDGRVFEHASDCRVLIDHLAQVNEEDSQSDSVIDLEQERLFQKYGRHDKRSGGPTSHSGQWSQRSSLSRTGSTMSKKDLKIEERDLDMGLCFIVLQKESSELGRKQQPSQSPVEAETEQDLDELKAQRIRDMDVNIWKELNIINPQEKIRMTLNKDFINLSMSSKGKADLYFHAYFWQEYLKCLNDIQEKAVNPLARAGSRASTDTVSTVGATSVAEVIVPESDPSKGSSSNNRGQASQKLKTQKTVSNRGGTNLKTTTKEGSTSQTHTSTEDTLDPQPSQLASEGGASLTSQEDMVDLLSADSDRYPFMKRLCGLASTMQKVIINIKKFPFTIDNYNKYLKAFAAYDNPKVTSKKNKYLEEIQRGLFVAQISDDKEALYLIEKLLIQLMGYCDMAVRDQAVVLLNMLYDEVDWQLQEAFRTSIRTIGQHFIINVNIKRDPQNVDQPEYFLAMSAPSPIFGNNKQLVSWHKVEPRNIIEQDQVSAKISINFGKFWKCGFFDWRLFEISESGKFIPCEIVGQPDPVFPIVRQENMFGDYYDDDEQNSGSIAQGRLIVHARGMKDHIFHEVQVDYQNAQFDKDNNQFLRRGTFKDVEQSIDQYQKEGVTALYIMGTLERDNYAFKNKYHGTTDYRKEDASPLAVTTRNNPNTMLGGLQGLQSVVNKAKQRKIKVIVDSVARISSSRHHRKYKELLLHYLNEEGQRHICYGTDGQAHNYQDTAMLNYRKIESWDLLIDEILEYADKTDVDGIHLDNGQAWPQIMEPDLEELSREDCDGEPAYTPEQLMAGEIVIRNENHGYWNTNVMETYPNPFFSKLCKKIWKKKPNFMIIGECWGGFMFAHRQIIMARSGIIPRLYKLPMALSSLFGKKLHKDGRIDSCTKENVVAIKKWYDGTRRFLPDGTICIQSSTAHSLPYPAHLYGRGAWAAIDILYFMPDVPITFMGETDGEVYNIGQQTVFQHEQTAVDSGQNSGLKRSNSKILLAFKQQEGEEEGAENSIDQALPSSEKRSIVKVSSRVNIAQSMMETGASSQITQREQEFKQSLDPRRGYDLSKINSHYKHRRHLRKEKMVLRYGEIFFLTARGENAWHEDILAFARYSLMETIIIAINLSDEQKSFYVDATAMMPTFRKAYQNNTVVMVKDCISEMEEPQYYFMREFLLQRQHQSLGPFRSSITSVQIIVDDPYLFKRCLTSSVQRMKKTLTTGGNIEAEQISLLFTDCLDNPQDIERFASITGSIQSSFLDKLNLGFECMFLQNKKLTDSSELTSKLSAMSEFIVNNARENPGCPAVRAAQSIAQCNKLGTIVFATPELGRWSTVGGLGVMVDELSIGLAKLGQTVTVISPYYERNRKGQTGYLAHDPAGIRLVDSFTIVVNNQNVAVSVHEGTVRDVKVVFLHNADAFPAPYPAAGAGQVVFALAAFSKAVLEYCCKRRVQPSIVVTNDWFTGLAAGYAKNGDFGDYYNDTKFLHICHNLQESYEGRLYPASHEGDLNRMHGLPREWFSDHDTMINPSKCALLKSDQWATVSKSYRQELLQDSGLRPILKQHSKPFAFPNGIPIQDRLQRLDQAAPDHLAAKRKIQMKYFNFQDLDDSIPLFAFVGRITAQKGCHLIMETAENVIQKYHGKVQFLVGGPANMGEAYAAQCAHKMWHLKNKFPNCFWAAPEEFFTDGSLVNRGTDFGLMPSAFEPGGIVQHEFFVGKTPVIAYKTGGLKDSVIEFKWDSEEGSGFTMEHHTHQEIQAAIDRAINTYTNKEKYYKLRENAFRATMDGEVVCKAWLSELCRVTDKTFVEKRIIDETYEKFTKPWDSTSYRPISIIQEIFGSEKRSQQFSGDIDQGATEKLAGEISPEGETKSNFLDLSTDPDTFGEIDTFVSAFDQQLYARKPKCFMLHNRGPRYNKVQLCGSMDEWKVRHDLQFDTFTNQWFVTMHLQSGQEYLYKYIINDQHWVTSDEEPQRKDTAGNVNNYFGFFEE